MADSWGGKDTSIGGPAANALAVTPNDTTDLTNIARGIYVGGAGDLKVDLAGSGTVTFTAVPAGTLMPIRARRVYSTGTTATSIVAVW